LAETQTAMSAAASNVVYFMALLKEGSEDSEILCESSHGNGYLHWFHTETGNPKPSLVRV
jgi:hypothetical protein